MASAEGKNFEAIVKAKEQHNKNCPFPPHTIRMNPFEIERMQWEEGDTIAGLVLEGDGRVGTGSFRLICDGEEPPELEIEETTAVSGPAEPLVVPVGPYGPHEDDEPPTGPRYQEPRLGNAPGMDPEQEARFAEAVERKKAEAQEASELPDPHAPEGAGGKVTLDATGAAQPGLQTDDRSSQDTFSVRDKNSGHGKKTADKWNQ